MATVPLATVEGAPDTGETPEPAHSVTPEPSAPRQEFHGEEMSPGTVPDWDGSRVIVRITADQTTVVTSTDVIGRGEYSFSLFRDKLDAKLDRRRRKLERLKQEAEADEEEGKGEESESEEITVDLWFDRNGDSLPIILSVMRGYDMTDLSVSEVKKKQIISDCVFYGVPDVSEHLFPGSIGESIAKSAPFAAMMLSEEVYPISHSFWNMSKGVFNVDRKNNTLEKCDGQGKWHSVGISHPFSLGMYEIHFRIVKSPRLSLMFGLIEESSFSERGYFGKPLKGIGYGTYSGNAYTKGRSFAFADPAEVGDVISLKTEINSDRSVATLTFLRNHVQMGRKDLSKYVSLKSPLIFAVALSNVGDVIQIVSSKD